MASNYKKLIVWQKSFLLTEEVYRLTKLFPKEELYALGDQMRRSSISLPSNIAEGSGRIGIPDKKRFYTIARGSACELETQLLIAKSMGYITQEKSVELSLCIEEILKMLTSLIYKE